MTRFSSQRYSSVNNGNRSHFRQLFKLTASDGLCHTFLMRLLTLLASAALALGTLALASVDSAAKTLA